MHGAGAYAEFAGNLVVTRVAMSDLASNLVVARARVKRRASLLALSNVCPTGVQYEARNDCANDDSSAATHCRLQPHAISYDGE